MSCRDCERQLEHCHEVLIVLADGSAECSGGPSCAGDAVVHEWIVQVSEVLPVASHAVHRAAA